MISVFKVIKYLNFHTDEPREGTVLTAAITRSSLRCQSRASLSSVVVTTMVCPLFGLVKNTNKHKILVLGIPRV